MGRRLADSSWLLLLHLLAEYTLASTIPPSEYGVVIDAGSTGTRVRIYRWDRRFYRTQVPHVSEIHKYKIHTGISSFANNLDDLEPFLLDFIEESKNYVPAEQYEETHLYLMATAGMRLLEEEVVHNIMDKIDDILEDGAVNPFRYEPHSARVLSGEEEGAFAWIALNYLRGYFTGETEEYMGVLEMGGASTQIAFLPEGSVLANKFNVDIGGHRYPLYVHSYIYRGNEEEYLLRKYPDETDIQDPCILTGDSKSKELHGRNITFEGAGDADQCLEIVNAFVYSAEPYQCNPKPCAIGPVYQPSIPEDRNFYAIGAFGYPIKAFGLEEDEAVSPGVILEEARQFCHLDFDTALRNSGDKPEYVSDNCRLGLFVATLLTKAYGFSPESEQLRFVSKINGQKITWSIGALLYEISRYDVTSDEGAYLMSVRSSAHSATHRSQFLSSASLSILAAFILVAAIWER